MVSSTTEVSSTFPSLGYEHGSRGQKYAKIISAAGDTRLLVAAVTGAKIRVLALALEQEPDAAATFQFLSGSTAISGEFLTISSRIYFVLPFSPAGWFETASSEALNVVVAGTALGGCLVYDEIFV